MKLCIVLQYNMEIYFFRNFRHTVAPSLYFLRGKFNPEILTGSLSGGVKQGRGGKINSFLSLSMNISITVVDTAKVRSTIND